MASMLLATLCERPSRHSLRRGGWRQRDAQSSSEDDVDARTIGQLARGLLLEYCDGWRSANRLCSHSRNAVDDGATCKLAHALGKLGGTRNANAGVVTLPEKLPLPGIISAIEGSSSTHFIRPTDLIRCFQQHYPQAFKLRLGACADSVASFWRIFFRSEKRRAWAEEHRYLRGRSAHSLRNAIPVVVHQDAGPYSKAKSADCICCSSLLAEGSEKITKFLLATCVADRGNDAAVWDEILRDLEVAAAGNFGGFSFILLFAKADEEQRCVKWGLPGYNDAHEVCADCLCNRSNRPYTDLSRSARWRGTETMPKEAFLARIRDHPARHLLAASPFFTRWFFYPDVMHLLDCHGIAGLVYGGLLCYLVTLSVVGRSIPDRLATINSERVRWYRAHPGLLPLPPIRRQNLRRDDWAELHGPAFKAANSRQASGFFLHLATKYLQGRTVGGQDLESCMWRIVYGLNDLYSLMWGQPRFLLPEHVLRIREACISFGEAYMRCRQWAKERGELAFNVTVKVHRMQHLAAMAEIMKPAWVSCYSEESSVGTTTRVWRQSMHGRYAKTVQHRVLLKRLCGLWLRLETLEDAVRGSASGSGS